MRLLKVDEKRVYDSIEINSVKVNNYWKAPCTFVKTPEGFDKA